MTSIILALCKIITWSVLRGLYPVFHWYHFPFSVSWIYLSSEIRFMWKKYIFARDVFIKNSGKKCLLVVEYEVMFFLTMLHLVSHSLVSELQWNESEEKQNTCFKFFKKNYLLWVKRMVEYVLNQNFIVFPRCFIVGSYIHLFFILKLCYMSSKLVHH